MHRLPSVRLRASLAACLLSGLLTPRAVQGQALGVYGMYADAGQELIGTIAGVGVSAEWPIGVPGLHLRLAAERLAGGDERTGRACGGFIPDVSQCPTEPLRDRATTNAFLAGLRLRALGNARTQLSLVGTLGASSANVVTTGESTGNRLSDSETYWRGDIGIEGRWHPLPAGPLGFTASGTIGWQAPFRAEEEIDGYTPLAEGARTFRISAGVVLQLR